MREGNFNFKVYLAAALKIFKLRLLAIFLGDGRTDELLLCCTPLRVFQHCWSGDDGPQLAHTHLLVRTTNTEGESETQSVVDLLLLPWSRRSGFPFCYGAAVCFQHTTTTTTLLNASTAAAAAAHKEGLSLPPGPVPRESHGT